MPSRLAQPLLNITLTLCAMLICIDTHAADLEDFGAQPFVRKMAMSPDGNRFAWLQEDEQKKMMLIYYIEQGKVLGGTGISNNIKARDVYFASDDYVILTASDARLVFGYRRKLEYSGAFSYHLHSNKLTPLLRHTEGLHPAQEGLGKIVGVNNQKQLAYMPAFNKGSTPRYNLYRVNLKTGKGRIHANGSVDTVDWFVDARGNPLAREDFDDQDGVHTFYSYASGKAKKIHSYETKLPGKSVQAVTADEQKLLFIEKNDREENVRALSLADGSISPVLYRRDGKDIDYLQTDINRQLVAVKYSGFTPSYEFTSTKTQAAFQGLLQHYTGSRVDLLDKTDDDNAFLVKISGNSAPNAFYNFDVEKNQVNRLITGYRNIEQKDLGEVIAFRYSARDGLKIPALLTWPADRHGKHERTNLPLIVMPHGGPNAYDAIGFDWLAQFLANKGYAVLQPNYRGSTGFGTAFHDAGYGRWGAEMRDDITDGVQYLIDRGVADKNRVCIAGASYGGYAALIGGAFTPELYRCVIAINGVTDIHAEIKKDINTSSKKAWLRNYWQNVFGEEKHAFKQLDKVSPYFYAEQFTAPTLIAFSKEDTVVAPAQSKKMHNALRKANKDSTLLPLKGEDHWLSTTSTRLQLLHSLNKFLDQHNPVQP